MVRQFRRKPWPDNCSGHRVARRVAVDPETSARSVGLRYVCDREPGFTRRRAGRGFSYWREDGTRIRDRRTLDRVRTLAIPPAWREVWIASAPDAHLQAVGRDARGRKQYRYHALWRAVRDDVKYERMLTFARMLAAVRRRVTADLRKRPLSRDQVLATVVRLLERTLIRVGNDEYARANRSYGLTTLRNRHVTVTGSLVEFRFRAKSGVWQAMTLRDPALAHAVRRCQHVPGEALFQYVDADGARHTVDSADVNDYLRSIAGDDFSAKDFRTWAGTVLAATALSALPPAPSATARQRMLVRAVDSVAARLGNTRAVCRQCYIHPAVLDAYADGETIDPGVARRHRRAGEALALSPGADSAVLALIARRLRPASRHAA